LDLSPVRWGLLWLGGLAATIVAFSEYRNLRQVQALPPEASFERLQATQPWGGLAARVLAASAPTFVVAAPDTADAIVAWHLGRYPLDARRWLHRAGFSILAQEEPEQALRHLAAAVAAQPDARDVNLRAAALSALAGSRDLADAHLRRWLQGQPRAVERALAVGGLWIEDPETVLDRLLPEGDEYLAAVLSHARRERRMELAALAWDRLGRPRAENDPALLDFVDLALAEQEYGAAIRAWEETYPDYRPGDVPNADFARATGPSGRGLNWNTATPPGVQAGRDTAGFVTPPASLRVDFDGRHSPRLGRPSVRIPLQEEGRSWAVTGYWRGEGLTTRGLPYLSGWAEGGPRSRLDVPGSTFDWTPFRLTVQAPEGSRLLQLEVRRDPPGQDFDRFLAGRIWLDALRVEVLHASGDGEATDEAE
jgi:hypothetical protein